MREYIVRRDVIQRDLPRYCSSSAARVFEQAETGCFCYDGTQRRLDHTVIPYRSTVRTSSKIQRITAQRWRGEPKSYRYSTVGVFSGARPPGQWEVSGIEYKSRPLSIGLRYYSKIVTKWKNILG